MKTTHEETCAELADDLTRYAWGELHGKPKGQIEAHLSHCPGCSETALFVKKLRALSGKRAENLEPCGEPCPDSALLVDLESDELDEVTAQHVRAHLISCRTCREEYLILRRLSISNVEPLPPTGRPNWDELQKKLADKEAELTRLEQGVQMMEGTQKVASDELENLPEAPPDRVEPEVLNIQDSASIPYLHKRKAD